MRKCQGNYKRKGTKKVPMSHKNQKARVHDSARILENEFKPRTKNQAEYVRSIAENVVTLCHGPAGTGKTCVAVAMACDYLINGKVDRILVTRPMIQCGRKGGGLGYLKGDLDEKFHPFMSPVLDELEFFLGKDEYRRCTSEFNKQIEVIPLELMKGKNFKRTFMICDEAENCEHEQLKMFLTRICPGSKCVISGDIAQTDIDKCNYEIIMNKLEGVKGLGIVELTYEDIQRDGIVADILMRI